MRIYPKPLEIGDLEGFSSGKDLFGKASLANGMSFLVSNVEDPLVIAFDGPWGSGKTTFLKMWAGELRKAGHPVIFFDAFENDYVEDAFAALAREIVELAESHKATDSQVSKSIKKEAVRLGALLLRGAAKVATRMAVRAATGGIASSTDFGGLADEIRAETDDVAEAYMQQLLDYPRQQKETSEAFRNALSSLPSLLAPSPEGEPQKPMIFIIDELDRCKPHFALALLERIKHFMSVPNVHFVLGVNIEQLGSSVKFAYGSSIDASAYLQKFINLTIYNMPNTHIRSQDDLQLYAAHLSKQLAIPAHRESPIEAAIETVTRLIRFEEMSYRTLERAFTVMALSIGLTPANHLQLGAIVGGLVMMKLIRPSLFKKAKRGLLTLEEAKEFLRFPPEENQSGKMGWEERWWTYLLADPPKEELADLGRSILFNYYFSQPRDIVKYTANNVIDRLLPA